MKPLERPACDFVPGRPPRTSGRLGLAALRLGLGRIDRARGRGRQHRLELASVGGAAILSD